MKKTGTQVTSTARMAHSNLAIHAYQRGVRSGPQVVLRKSLAIRLETIKWYESEAMPGRISKTPLRGQDSAIPEPIGPMLLHHGARGDTARVRLLPWRLPLCGHTCQTAHGIALAPCQKGQLNVRL